MVKRDMGRDSRGEEITGIRMRTSHEMKDRYRGDSNIGSMIRLPKDFIICE